MFKTLITAFLFVLFFSISADADVLLIDRVESKTGMDIPKKSSTMNQVRAQYGDPISESAPVGEPQITRWEYQNFIVFFEHQHVITTVLKKSTPTEIGPDSVQ